MSAGRRPRVPRPLAAGLALLVCGFALPACSEVESNVRETYPYKSEPIKGSDINRVTMADETADLIPVETTSVRRDGKRKVVPHGALIYNPDGDTFVYGKPKPKTYIRVPVEVVDVEGDRAVLSAGPPVGTTIVTLGAAELLATEYEILDQHP
ncbi:MAG: hypothetical protein ABR529_04375 [Actinomycetota bacterium]